MSLYPLRFEPIFQYRLWGGRKLERYSREPLGVEGPVGEAWILSDRDDFASKVAEGELKGKTLRELLHESGEAMLGAAAGQYDKYPLLLKFLDAKEVLSVQVHPSDAHKELLPKGERGKTESWLVLESEEDSKIFLGLNEGVTPEEIREKSKDGTVAEDLASFHPRVGDGAFIRAGTVHALGDGVLVFECQQNSDVTFRLFDWNRVDEKTGKPRELHIDKAVACIDFSEGPVGPVTPQVLGTQRVLREGMFACEFFTVERLTGEEPFSVGVDGEMRVLVCLEGAGSMQLGEALYDVRQGDVYVLPAEVGGLEFKPEGKASLAQVAVPKGENEG